MPLIEPVRNLANPPEKPKVLIPVEESMGVMTAMWGLTLHQPEMKNIGYQYTEFTGKEISEKRRCQRCPNLSKSGAPYGVSTQNRGRQVQGQGAQPNWGGRNNVNAPPTERELILPSKPNHWINARTDRASAYKRGDREIPEDRDREVTSKAPVCWFHPGNPVMFEGWTCCRGSILAPGCASRPKHKQLPKFSEACSSHYEDFKMHRTPDLCDNPCSAVVLKTETGTALRGGNELIRLVMIDFYSGKILIDKIVLPDKELLHTNHMHTGISAETFLEACRNGDFLFGRAGAREMIWQRVGPQTRVVLHDGRNEMINLRWIHGMVVDTHELEGRCAGDNQLYFQENAQARQLSYLAKRHLDRRLSSGRANDTVENAMACRDLLVHYLQHLPVAVRRLPEGAPYYIERPYSEPDGRFELYPGDRRIDSWLVWLGMMYGAMDWELGDHFGISEQMQINPDLEAPWWGDDGSGWGRSPDFWQNTWTGGHY